MCEGCHGVTDYRNAFPDVYRVPKLGEQQAAYIVKALQDYKSGQEGGLLGANITIFERGKKIGGALDAHGSPETGSVLLSSSSWATSSFPG